MKLLTVTMTTVNLVNQMKKMVKYMHIGTLTYIRACMHQSSMHMVIYTYANTS